MKKDHLKEVKDFEIKEIMAPHTQLHMAVHLDGLQAVAFFSGRAGAKKNAKRRWNEKKFSSTFGGKFLNRQRSYWLIEYL